MWTQPIRQPVYPPMLNEHEPLIVNAAAHLAGAIVFGIFLALTLGGRAGRRPRQSWLPIAAAGLAFLWNAGSLAIFTLPQGTFRWAVEAVIFCSLSLLPAVLLHLSLNGKPRAIAIAGYLLSAIATGMHLSEDLQPGLHLHKLALWLITVGFGALTTIYAVWVLRAGKASRRRTPQMLASMGLLLFAVTFSHFGAGRPPQPWKELFVHHAGIAVALVILLQDYRFVFLDAFLRFLANVLLAAGLSYGALLLAAQFAGAAASHPLADVFAVAALCGVLVLFAYLRGVLQRWFTSVVFGRSRLEAAARDLRSDAGETQEEDQFLRRASERIAAALNTRRFEIFGPAEFEAPSTLKDLDYPSLAGGEPSLSRDPRCDWAEAIVPIRLSLGDARYLLLGRRDGGRRYLSEDLRSLNYLATVVGEEVDRFRAAEMQRLISEAELRALHSQINPHFLFNALNTIYGVIPREAADARRTVLNLADIFRYSLQSDRVLIPLGEELRIVNAYLEIERLRLGSRLQTEIQVDAAAEETMIPILSIQPLVENGIKHGVAMGPDRGWLRLKAVSADGALKISVENSGAGAAAETSTEAVVGSGVGLANVSRRLQLCFGPDAGVTLERGPFGARVSFSVPLAPVAAPR